MCMWRKGSCPMLLRLWDPGVSYCLESHRAPWPEEAGTWEIIFCLLKAFAHSSLARGHHRVTFTSRSCDGEKRNQRTPNSLKNLHVIVTSYTCAFLSERVSHNRAFKRGA